MLGVLAGRDMPTSQLQHWVAEADTILAADAGADILLEIGIRPNYVIGDLDSIQAGLEQSSVHHDPDQSLTDCDKLLAKSIELGHEKITLSCVEGDQLDHMIATLHSAARHPIHVQVALRTGIGFLLVTGEKIEIQTEPGRRVSLLPLAHCDGVTLKGVEWPLDNDSITPLGQTSIGNKAVLSRICVEILSGVAFLYVERLLTEGPVW